MKLPQEINYEIINSEEYLKIWISFQLGFTKIFRNLGIRGLKDKK